MKKVLLIGTGAREHAVAEMLRAGGAQVFVYGPGRNPGLLQLAEGYEVGGLKDFAALREFALRVAPNFAFVGPENPLGDGVVDALLEIEIQSASPLQTVARLESSKSFTRDLMEKYGIKGNPKFKVFLGNAASNAAEMRGFLEELGGDFVVKGDGLMGGKGVKVSGDHLANVEEGMAFAAECLEEGGRVVIEEKLIGQEFSLMSFCDGVFTAEMPAIQDHKRAFEGDKGPNTGGMGTYSDVDGSLPFLRASDVEQAAVMTRKVAAALLKETGCQFKGIMYGGFMATRDGVRLIEYNARFGDPEVLNIPALLKTNFVQVCEAIIAGDLQNLPLEFARKATVCKYVVPEGYPDHPQSGAAIEVGAVPDGVKIYYSSVDLGEDGVLRTSSSRAIGFVGVGDSLEEAEKFAESGCGSVKGPVFYRHDIGTAALVGQRVEMMKKLRG